MKSMMSAVLVLIALLAQQAHCFPTMVDLQDLADADVQTARGVQDEVEVAVEDAEEEQKQATAPATQTASAQSPSAQVATVLMLPTLLNPLLNNIATGITNALSATIMGREIAFIPPDSPASLRSASIPQTSVTHQ